MLFCNILGTKTQKLVLKIQHIQLHTCGGGVASVRGGVLIRENMVK